MDNEHRIDRAWTLFIIVIVACGLIACLGLVAITRADEHPLCSYFEALSHEEGVQVAVWIGYPLGWQDYPQKWDWGTLTDLVGGSAILTRSKGGKRWLWGFRTLKEDNGNHDFCEDVLIISDEP